MRNSRPFSRLGAFYPYFQLAVDPLTNGLRKRHFKSTCGVFMTDQHTARDADKAIEDLIRQIRQEPLPRKMVELAKSLQDALDKRDAGLKK